MNRDLVLAIVLGVLVVAALSYVFVFQEQVAQPNLSGRLVPIEDNLMPDAPCHFMANQWMGDCRVREITLEASQYAWSEEIIRVRVGELIRLRLTSVDVAHGFFLPEANINVEIQPGQEQVVEFMAPSVGEYSFFCSVFCGEGHQDHKGVFIVIDP